MAVLIFCQSVGSLPPLQPELWERFRGRAWIWLTPHLNDWPEDSPWWARLKHQTEPVWVFTALYPQAAHWLLARHGLTPPQVQVISLQALPEKSELERILNLVPGSFAASQQREVNAVLPNSNETTGENATAGKETGVQNWGATLAPRWYPVINRDSCTNCMHCLQFCLFGVYETGSAGELLVAHPDQCKPGCPACARVCPTGAILFPMYERDPKIAGSAAQASVAHEPSLSPTFDDLDQLVTQMEQAVQRRR